MTAKTLFYASSLIILPALYALFYIIRVERWLPREAAGLVLLGTLIALEQVYRYKYAVSQRTILIRDIIANVVNRYVTSAVVGMIVLPILLFFPEHFLGRKVFLASPAQLGPFWFQVAVILLSVSFFRYWIHRVQHSVDFLWELHSYHHRVTDLTALNTDVSHPIDFALRNVVIFLVLGVVGFDPLVILITVPATNISAGISHWGADVKGGFLNYLFVTPEVHRWHHSAEVPEGHKYSVNYGVEFSFWDILFGTFHLPQKAARCNRHSAWGILVDWPTRPII
jgi:sterol desaturase/sphingolipid hydroxylase (fatty acid hydroxylase superfamily)